MGEMAEYWKEAKPYLKERRKQHVKRMGDSAIKNIKSLGFEFTHYPIIINLRSIRQKA